MKRMLLVISAAAVVAIALLLSGCGASHHESPQDAVELSKASVGDVVVFGDIRWYVTARTETGCTLLTEKPVIKMPFRAAEYQATNT